MRILANDNGTPEEQERVWIFELLRREQAVRERLSREQQKHV